ncbi:RNA-directed DNA polymerase, eukaryota, nucleotide-binding alpha-beta plait domain protein [Tanacetum coccineum]
MFSRYNNLGSIKRLVTSRDLWRECNAFGTVVDVFIPFKKSKAGKRFAFVRFIKVFNLDRLVKILCTIWIGRHHLYANQVRFERLQKPNFPSLKDTNRVSEKSQFVSGFQQSKGSDSYVNVVNGISPCFADVNVLYLRGLWVMLEFNKEESKSKLMQHTGVKSWFHSIQDVTHDFVCDERIVWVNIEGIPLYAWSRETFSRIGNKWGETLDIEDTNETSFGRKRVCIKTKHPISILESFKIIVKGKDIKVKKSKNQQEMKRQVYKREI